MIKTAKEKLIILQFRIYNLALLDNSFLNFQTIRYPIIQLPNWNIILHYFSPAQQKFWLA